MSNLGSSCLSTELVIVSHFESKITINSQICFSDHKSLHPSQSSGFDQHQLEVHNVVRKKCDSGEDLRAYRGESNVHQEDEDQEEGKGNANGNGKDKEKKSELTLPDDTIGRAISDDGKIMDKYGQQQLRDEEKGDDTRELADDHGGDDEDESDECLSAHSKADDDNGQCGMDTEHREQPERMVNDGANMRGKSRTPGMKRKSLIAANKRLSRSTSPPTRRSQLQMIRIQPAIPANANIRLIMENVVKTEGPFEHPEEALKAAIVALKEETW